MAEMTNRFDDMAMYMKQLCSLKPSITILERNLVSIAYKNAVGSRRNALRKLRSMNTQQNHVALSTYTEKVCSEIVSICNDATSIARHLLSTDDSINVTDRIFLTKIVGDYNRYMAEFLAKDHACVKVANDAYKSATDYAKRLRPAHATRLGVALNFSVFHLEILGNRNIACKIAKEAFDSAADDLIGLGEKEFRNTSIIMELISDNILLWSDKSGEENMKSDDGVESSSSSKIQREERALSEVLTLSPRPKKVLSPIDGSTTPPPKMFLPA